MIMWLRSLFAWETVLDTGCVIFQRNRITGKRKARRYAGLGPDGRDWVRTGQFSIPHPPQHMPPPNSRNA